MIFWSSSEFLGFIYRIVQTLGGEEGNDLLSHLEGPSNFNYVFLNLPFFYHRNFLSSRANWFCLSVYLLSSSLNSWRLKTLCKVSNLFHTPPCPWSLSHLGDIHFLTLKMLLPLFPLLWWLSRPAAQLAPRGSPSPSSWEFCLLLSGAESQYFRLYNFLFWGSTFYPYTWLDFKMLSLCWTVFLRTLKELLHSLPES